jgi:hypothetical protein
MSLPINQLCRALIGAVQDTQADQGLLVCWGGFKKTVEQRRNELFFRIRLWGRAEILEPSSRSMTGSPKSSVLNYRCGAPGCSFPTKKKPAHNRSLGDWHKPLSKSAADI